MFFMKKLVKLDKQKWGKDANILCLLSVLVNKWTDASIWWKSWFLTIAKIHLVFFVPSTDI